jgi:hypothetical protein
MNEKNLRKQQIDATLIYGRVFLWGAACGRDKFNCFAANGGACAPQ